MALLPGDRVHASAAKLSADCEVPERFGVVTVADPHTGIEIVFDDGARAWAGHEDAFPYTITLVVKSST